MWVHTHREYHGLGIHTKWSWTKGSFTQIGNELQSGHELWVHTQSCHGLGIHTKWSWAKGSYPGVHTHRLVMGYRVVINYGFSR